MDLQAFVNGLQPHAFRSLMAACMERLQTETKEVAVLTDAERELARRGHRVPAMVCLRKRTGMGIVDARNVVDAEIPKQTDDPEVEIVRCND